MIKRKYNNARLANSVVQSEQKLRAFDQRRNQSDAKLKGILYKQD